MKIAVWHNLPSGGGKRALYDYVRVLVQRGHTVEAWCPTSADRTYLPLSDFIVEHVKPLDWNFNPSLNITERFKAKQWNAVKMFKAVDRHCLQCAEEINNGEFDLLFVHSCMFLATSPIARYVTIPKVLYLQEPRRSLYEASPVLPFAALPPLRQSWRTAGYLKKFLKDLVTFRGMRIQAREEILSAQSFDVILVNSCFSRESILRVYGLDAKVCYLGIDLQRFTNRDKPREHFILGIGSFTPEKNIKFIIESLAKIPEPRPKFIWIGNDKKSQYLDELTRLSLSTHVDFEAKIRIQDSELVDLLNRASIMVYAPRLEPFGYAPLEAHACGLPVVAVAEGGVRETVISGVNGLLVEHELGAFAAAIQHLLNNPEYACHLGKNGRQIVAERWSLEAAVDRLEQRLALALRGYNDYSNPTAVVNTMESGQ